ncbi:MAG: repeat:HAT (Half-A-TPR) repeat, partial [Proteobacteria bacterium]|nr:repeat:HAT (Half-A-TPR) repeat [Pseudomonadota bacterium]
MNLLKWLQTKAEKFFTQTPEPQIFDAQSPLLLEGQNHQRNGDLNSALNCYHKEIEESPFNPYGHLALGNILAATGQFEEAAKNFQEAARLKPDFVEAHCNLGSCLKDTGRLQEAIVSYRRAIEISPDFITAHLNVGNTLLNLGQLEQAEESFQKALQL